MAAQVRAAHAARVIHVSEGPFQVLAALPKQSLAARPTDPAAITVDGGLRVCACGSSGGAACGAGGVMAWERGRRRGGAGARGR
jgi:hypothetical protein